MNKIHPTARVIKGFRRDQDKSMWSLLKHEGTYTVSTEETLDYLLECMSQMQGPEFASLPENNDIKKDGGEFLDIRVLTDAVTGLSKGPRQHHFHIIPKGVEPTLPSISNSVDGTP